MLKADEVYKKRGQANVDRDLITALLSESSKFSEEVLAPLNVVGDREGVKHDPATNTVTTPKGFKVRRTGAGRWLARLTRNVNAGGLRAVRRGRLAGAVGRRALAQWVSRACAR